MLGHLLLERVSLRELQRVPEPTMAMDDPAQVEAFWECGSAAGVLASTYLFNAVQTAHVIRPGDKVLDLACGPANQLVQFARLHPDADFLGIDHAASMIDRARDTVARSGVRNVALRSGDMTSLAGLADASVDCVTCTFSLHHLPEQGSLQQAFREVARVLKPGGGIYICDFGRLKRHSTQAYFAHERREQQTDLFTQDFLNSLKAAFTLADLRRAAALLGGGVGVHQTALAPFMVVLSRPTQAAASAATRDLAMKMVSELSRAQQRDFGNLSRWFRIAGLPIPLDLD
ncbi:class I SAM-dependent methyltransferase [Ramlibacter sp. MMS24-I3-19]|uniref:class I SAM-dependent methyltransferase n=1 Tax=Ramlibacter sp. MMS24-I3-19 TaxID=3416606 RepID=UPI003D04C2FC